MNAQSLHCAPRPPPMEGCMRYIVLIALLAGCSHTTETRSKICVGFCAEQEVKVTTQTEEKET